MRGQHRLKYLTVVAAVWLSVGSALTSLAQAQGGATGSAPPSPVASPAPLGAGFTPTRSAAIDGGAPLSPIDHAAWVSNRPSDLRPGDHLLIIRREPVSSSAASANGATPLAASRPQPHHTPAASPGQPAPSVPMSQPQPVAMRTPSASAAVVSQAPAPAATPKLMPGDHVLLVSVHPPGASGSASAIDHAGSGYLD